jgi:hypothetical protein
VVFDVEKRGREGKGRDSKEGKEEDKGRKAREGGETERQQSGM